MAWFYCILSFFWSLWCLCILYLRRKHTSIRIRRKGTYKGGVRFYISSKALIEISPKQGKQAGNNFSFSWLITSNLSFLFYSSSSSSFTCPEKRRSFLCLVLCISMNSINITSQFTIAYTCLFFLFCCHRRPTLLLQRLIYLAWEVYFSQP